MKQDQKENNQSFRPATGRNQQKNDLPKVTESPRYSFEASTFLRSNPFFGQKW
jgi:hypothetical protein